MEILETKEDRNLTREQIQNAVMIIQAWHKRNDSFEILYPELSAEKQNALYFIRKGNSYREAALKIERNHTIITQWSKNDPKFKQALEEVKMEIQKSIRLKDILLQAAYEEKTSTSKNDEEIENPSLEIDTL
ncbi:hypothetical protein [Leptospira meyeri]|uniref:hypothetical protein n=1 Tax=Leptospira meyeri TaxID=29508 RepID=UPI000C29EB19|nr:hypothetical protein [Leptospira meyeri]PJZ79267.1 hypothetical protein CH359_19025 [Leptospira meyeri]PJZ95101.1 hypothetical protein CH358_18985 [Leptospira meyeri]